MITHHTGQPPASEINLLVDGMGYDPTSMKSLVERSGLTSDNLSAMLLMLELDGKVASLHGGVTSESPNPATFIRRFHV